MSLKDRFSEDWFKLLEPEFSKPYCIALQYRLKDERKKYTIYPKQEDVFRAFQLTPYGEVKVVVISQDPYHNGNADGLAFSVPDHLPANPSIRRIIKGIEDDCYDGLNLEASTDLTYLAKQGVLLINRSLTVRAGQANSHALLGWEPFTTKVIQLCNEICYPVVFMLLGKESWGLSKLIEKPKHHVIIREHPVAGVYRSGFKPEPWIHDNCFTSANEFMKEENNWVIKW